MQVDKNVSDWLQAQGKSNPSFASNFALFDKLYDQKLWHELTTELEKVTAKPDFAKLLLPLYDNFLKHWQSKMNKISLIKILSRICKQKDPKSALAFLEPFATDLKSNQNHQDAYVLVNTEIAHYKLAAGSLDDCLNIIGECEKILEKLPSSDPFINAGFYKTASEYYKVTKEYQKFYHHALLFLSSVSLDDLSLPEKQERAFDLCMSALLAQGLYNFGELLMHPILITLTNSSYSWLGQLIMFYNSGDLQGFDSISKTAEFLNQPLLVSSIPFLREKLCLMTLMESVFRRTKEDRSSIPFAAIAKETRVALDEVEHLVMKALSLGLIKGNIDEVDSIVSVTWVQPRVLSKAQIKHIADRIKDWREKVNSQVVELQNEEAFKTVFVQ